MRPQGSYRPIFSEGFEVEENLRVVHVEGELLVLELEHVVVGAGGVHQVVARSGLRLCCEV